MGCIGKVTMPLLSTLAALVIIVHTAEENYEEDYRVMRTRSMDLVAPPKYDQSWRAIDIEPAITESLQQNHEGWMHDDDRSGQPVRKRRRKRKRRPQLSSPDEQPPVQEEFVIHDELYSSNQQDGIEMPRRRRKKNEHKVSGEPHRRDESIEVDQDKPIRRRGHRRKRPIVKSWPELSEFNGYRNERPEDPIENNNTRTEIDLNQDGNNDAIDVEPELKNNDKNEPYFEEIQTVVGDEKVNLENNSSIDKSLSEFSMESSQTRHSDVSEIIVEKKIKDKISITNDVDKSQESKPLDPGSLKTLLKKSNGKSLSEILQQNNLTLSDLLHGKEKALSVLKIRNLPEIKETKIVQDVVSEEGYDRSNKINRQDIENSDEDAVTDCTTVETVPSNNQGNISESAELVKREESRNSDIVENTTKNYLRRRFPVGIRRGLRMRPAANSSYKGQLSRDLITLSSMKYKNTRNMNKSREWKDIIPAMMKRRSSTESNVALVSEATKIATTTLGPEDTTTDKIFETTTDSDSFINTEVILYQENDNLESLNTADTNIIPQTTQPTTTTNKELVTEKLTVVEKPKINPLLRPLLNSSELRRQAYNNRLKRKRMKQKIVNTEEHEVKDIFGAANFVSAANFIEKTQRITTNAETDSSFTTLEDFITTESSQISETSHVKSTKDSINAKKTTSTTSSVPITTEETAKYEIEEILNDSLTSAMLSRILQERNMTLSELVEHRERGSSHVHLADIFHNASREPNPPEPFLSKSLLEPISKETYPLRALLDANLHDSKTTTVDTNSFQTNNVNIPVIMDFGNNVNENGENMGIISLFNNFSKINKDVESQKKENKENQVYDKSNNDNDLPRRESSRESRTLNLEKDLLSWNDLINLMQKNNRNGNGIETEKVETDNSPTFETLKNIRLDDVDGDGLIVLEDLQNLKNFDSRPTSDELLEIKLYENNDIQIPNAVNSSLNMTTKSVMVATASIIGLGLVLFLLTYATLKWKQQNKVYHNKHSKEDECVPTPVFENRKGHKINSSTRSKSPMLSSNIYTIDSMDTHEGNESTEYMWDSLRKPFQ